VKAAPVAEGSLAAPTDAAATPRRRAPRLDELLPRWMTFAPALLLMLGLGVLPLLNLLYTSFHTVSWSGGQATFTPVGFAHYANLPFDPLLRAGLGNTVIFALFAVAGQMVLGFALALLCSRVTRGRVFYRALFILPILVPGIVIGAIWKLMLNFDFGLINQVVELIGFEARNWLGDKETALASVIVVDIWHWTPFCFLLLLAGLESLPQDPYEAAKIDGASWWQELRFITLPLMAQAILVTFAFRMVIAFKVFDEVYLLTAGGPGTATEVLSFTLYQRFFREDRAGYGGAMAIAIMFICALLLVVALSVRRRSERSA
jgi:multiple sugar transport system permease protein